MARSLFFVRLLKSLFPLYFKGAVLARRIPILGRIIHFLFFRGDHSIFLPNDRFIRIDERIERPEQVPLPSQIAEYFVRKARCIWIMNTCMCREAEGCGEHSVDIGCMFLGDAVLHISPKLGRLVTADEALAHLRRGKEEGLVHMIGKNRIDAIWTGAVPREKLMTICSCCSCCCLWRLLPSLPDHISANVSRMHGVTVRVTDRCVGCGTCVSGTCFVNAIALVDGRAVISDACRACGRCVEVCPAGAIEISIEDPSFIEKTLEKIGSIVDVS